MTYIKRRGISLRNHCRAEPPRHPQPSRLLGAVGRRNRASAGNAAASRIQAPAVLRDGRLRGGHRGCAAPSTGSSRNPLGGRRVAGTVPPLLVPSPRRSGAPPRPHGSVEGSRNTNQNTTSESTSKEKEFVIPQSQEQTSKRRKQNENQSTPPSTSTIRRRPCASNFTSTRDRRWRSLVGRAWASPSASVISWAF